ncbi:MAG: hypothetical protein JSS96_03690 [Bacteroidetes bacterium]|nr:hypothetical protein [Bacteroidota bacterium]
MSNYDRLISRLDAFIRKYYANQVIRGSLIFLICLLFYILAVSVGEYFLYMPVWLRVSIVSLFVAAGIVSLVIWVVIPLTKMTRLGKIISHEQAANIVGRHFPEISDKLLNILQLRRQVDPNSSIELIEASIDQKAKQLSVVPISAAIDFSKNRKYLPYLLPLLLVGIFILVAAPNVFRDASERLLQPTRTFEKPAPFKFIITTMPLKAVRNNDYILKVEVTGNALPDEMYLEMGADKVPMQVLEKHSFQYTFKNVTEPVSFRLFAAGFYSETYTLAVVQKPVLKAFKVQIDYPDYTGKKDELRNSLGDMTLPVGTKVTWAFVAEHTDAATLRFGDGAAIALPKSASMFGYQYRFMNDTNYTFALQNKQSSFVDSYRYQVQVIPDQYPVIQVQEHRDTVSGSQILLNGSAGDDYGISRVLFHYEISNDKREVLSHKSVVLKATPGALTAFQYYFDVQNLFLQPGQRLSYYIEAWDNDGVHGSKASRSEVMEYRMYDAKQVDSAINANSQQINSSLSNSAQKTQQLQSEYKDMQSKMLQSDKMDWEQQQSLQEMMQKQQQVQNQLENTKKRFEEQKKQSEQKQYSDDLKEKQNEMEKQLDNLLNKELQEQMKKLQELMQKLNKDNAFQAMQQMQQENKLFNMDLQRMQELMQKMEMQMRMEDMANKMDELAKKETDLKAQTEQAKKDNQSLAKDQKDIKNELNKAMQGDMKEMQQLNDKLEQKQSLDDAKKSAKDAAGNMDKSEQQLGGDDKKKASESESKAAENLQDMAATLRQQASGMDMKQIELDIRAVRQILTNLIRLSFDQEDLMKSVEQTSPASQTYLTNQQEQNRLHDNSIMIRDSLYKLSKRLVKLAPTVNKETTELEQNMGTAVDDLENRRISDAVTRQQYVMTHTNNLALMLNEMLSNLLQMQAQAQKGGKGSCNNPGGKTPKPGTGQQLSDIITKQQQLGNGMQGMMQKGQGNKPGQGQQGNNGQGSPSGNNGQQNEYGDAEQLARFAEQQAAIRRQLQELSSLLNSKGMGNSHELQDIQKQMDKNETDLVNRRLSSEMQMRQKEILTKLLEAQKAIREQEQDDKRSSHTAQEISRPVPPELQKYMLDQKQLLEVYKTVPPQLKPYYRSMVEQYYQMIGHK